MHMEQHDLECPFKLIKCDKCGQEVARKDLKDHDENKCPERVVKCIFHTLGCAVESKHYDLDEHLRKEMDPHVVLMGKTIVEQQDLIAKYQVRLNQLQEQAESQEQELRRSTTARQKMEAHLITLEGREAAFEKKCAYEVRRITTDAAYDSKRKADAVQYEARKQLDAMRKEVTQIGGSTLQGIRKDVEYIKTKLK